MNDDTRVVVYVEVLDADGELIREHSTEAPPRIQWCKTHGAESIGSPGWDEADACWRRVFGVSREGQCVVVERLVVPPEGAS